MARNFVQTLYLKSVFALVWALLVPQLGHASTATNPLKMFKRYFGTIDIASNGIGTRGTGQLDPATGLSLTKCQPSGGCTISVPSVPPTADIVAAFLYWETMEKTNNPSSSVGYLLDPDPTLLLPPNPNPQATTSASACRGDVGNPACLSYPAQILGKPLGNSHAAPCWSSGGSTGNSNGAPTLRVYRADVLRYLKYNASGKKVPMVTVELSDSGSKGGTAPLTEGATL